jgi:hypothetical protein
MTVILLGYQSPNKGPLLGKANIELPSGLQIGDIAILRKMAVVGCRCLPNRCAIVMASRHWTTAERSDIALLLDGRRANLVKHSAML